jgi:hypothetical protein
MFAILSDSRTAGRWGSLPGLLTLLTGDHPRPMPDPTRYVWRWVCQYCERHFVGTGPTRQPCPECGRPLHRLGVWDLREQFVPKWWRDRGGLP